jgi:hypothetical protein
MNINLADPSWISDSLRAAILGVTGYLGSRFLDNQLKARKDAQILTENVIKLTAAVENADASLERIKAEIHEQVHGLKTEIHEQVNSLREETREARLDQRDRITQLEKRVDCLITQANRNQESIKILHANSGLDL